MILIEFGSVECVISKCALWWPVRATLGTANHEIGIDRVNYENME